MKAVNRCRLLNLCWPYFDDNLSGTVQTDFPWRIKPYIRVAKAYSTINKTSSSCQESYSRPTLFKIAGICFCLAGRFLSAQRIFQELSQRPGILDADNLYSYALTKAGEIAEGRGDSDLAYRNYSLANQRGYELAGHALIKLSRRYFNKGMVSQALRLIGESKVKKAELGTHIMPMRSVKSHCIEFDYSYYEIYPSRPIAELSLSFLEEGSPLTSEEGDLLAPPFYIALMEKTVGISKCNIVVSNRQVVLDGVTHPVFYRSGLGDTYDKEKIMLSRNGKKRWCSGQINNPRCLTTD